ncbi:hypothetical protein FF38_08991 [Lucilia cuprina]|uniref:Protein commissureless n=1 Tax=Lucilia cuprina TaxID=7375 RepID=A0A0L0CNN2_LUCCU|nr:uncharacterized protein LOC111679503 [Lucilia cuprina]KAI8115279.1 hypothetical protein CVS40_12466 [Lucilia cuprina]KNC33837.1 hypothetical protein FF38_08991 [Lucilia cuprina]
MSSKSFKWHILLFLFSFIVLADLALAGPTIVRDDEIIESLEEIDELNKNNSILRDSSAEQTSDAPFRHRDEDMMADLKKSTIFASLKYDVEILESGEVKKEDVELEERYRGPAITLNTDNFINENIEVNADAEEERAANKAIATSHLILSIVLVVVALVSIGLYAALVVWRSHIEQRYGMRELLVTSDNQDYWPQDVITSVVAQHQQQYQEQLQQQRQQQL